MQSSPSLCEFVHVESAADCKSSALSVGSGGGRSIKKGDKKRVFDATAKQRVALGGLYIYMGPRPSEGCQGP
jgi:hypothetical protein